MPPIVFTPYSIGRQDVLWQEPIRVSGRALETCAMQGADR